MKPTLFFFAGLFVSTALGDIKCYTCVSQGGGDDTCIKRPAAVPNPITKCTYKYCTIRRIEYASEPGVIQSFIRGCEDEPMANGEHPSSDVVVWAQSCDYSDLCNVGDGLSTLKPGAGAGGGTINGPVIIIPPSSNSASQFRFSTIHLFLAFSTMFLMHMN